MAIRTEMPAGSTVVQIASPSTGMAAMLSGASDEVSDVSPPGVRPKRPGSSSA